MNYVVDTGCFAPGGFILRRLMAVPLGREGPFVRLPSW
jgi:hypothetical protein